MVFPVATACPVIPSPILIRNLSSTGLTIGENLNVLRQAYELPNEFAEMIHNEYHSRVKKYNKLLKKA